MTQLDFQPIHRTDLDSGNERSLDARSFMSIDALTRLGELCPSLAKGRIDVVVYGMTDETGGRALLRLRLPSTPPAVDIRFFITCSLKGAHARALASELVRAAEEADERALSQSESDTIFDYAGPSVSLFLVECRLSGEAKRVIADALLYPTALQKLVIFGKAWTDAGAAALANALRHEDCFLIMLVIREPGSVSDEAWEDFASGVALNKSIECIFIKCEMSTRCAAALVAALRVNTKLYRLTLSGSDLSGVPENVLAELRADRRVKLGDN